MASQLSSIATPDARLTVDMPIKGKGEIRLALTDASRRVTVWGPNMDDALRQLIGKLTD
ncbi:hypothetical protein [Sphingomonas sp. 3-13AW]|uniref:hypothetical protein n=1 Tax=Sphingomonas sp. 3-13AW TaxID=3050450 RepID=UPI003BB78452